MKEQFNLEFKWTTSRARDSYGYNVVTLYVDGTKQARCNGGGYDMQGTVLGTWTQHQFKELLLKRKEPFYGLTFHDPNYNPSKAKIEGETIAEREQKGKSFGLERYQAFYEDSSEVSTKTHTEPIMDGATGLNNVEKLLKTIGYQFEWIVYDKGVATLRKITN